MHVDNRLSRFLFAAALACTSGCTSGADARSNPASPIAPTPITPAPVTLVALRVIGAQPLLNTTAQLDAIAVYSDSSTKVVTSQAVWSSSDATVARVDGGGAATGIGSGDADISAAYQNLRATLHVAIADPPPVLSEPIVDLAGTYDAMTKRLGALECTFEFEDSPADRWCFDPFGNTIIPGHVAPSFDYKVANGSAVVAATPGIVVTVVSHEEDGMFPGEYTIDTRPNSNSIYLVEYDHVRDVTVSVGSLVTPGMKLGIAGLMRPGSSEGRVEMQVNKTLSTRPVIQLVSLCPSPLGTDRFNRLNAAALAANNDANPMYAHPNVCLRDTVTPNRIPAPAKWRQLR